ncbi:LOW QUALITY PROTEIN: CCCH zinc finger domain-containingprotein [Purpureocillium lavendulum]|uniref:CCCH zinc finger domain-containingprotein n=1 Tax=Purpureocillium lavendulum TaxID=1247861 RepID=A0AB34FPB8_9HYPO|nr:LOW QUALITY PROTEIN: CCCH zinc finger domain-containingprotein [Purpureocillium lavendulum]
MTATGTVATTPGGTARVLERLPAMTICKFFQQGNCKFGNSCKFEHPRGQSQSQNRFGALGGGAAGGGSQNALTKYSISGDVIEKDLTLEKPQWILSAYGPGRDAPDQLFGGYPREQSFEELRLHFLTGKAAGNEQQAARIPSYDILREERPANLLNEAQQLYQNAQQQMETALRDVQGAARFIVERESQHPNRHDICREGTQGAPFGEFEVAKRSRQQMSAAPAQANPFSTGASSTQSPFGAPSQPPAGGAFGQPSALGQKPNPFGTPAFGQPAQPASAFGQPSQPASAFGQPSQPASSSPFGQAPQGGGSAFGQAAQPASGFGQPSALGAKPNPFGTPAFGQAAQPNAQGSAFGQAGQLGQKPNPFASNANTNAAPGTSPFAAMGGGGAGDNALTTSPFAAQGSGPANAAPNPFSSPAGNQNTQSPFGQAGGQGQAGASPFSQASAPAASPFGAGNQQQPPAANNPFGQPSQPQINGTLGQAASNPFAQNAPQNAQGAANPFAQQQPPAASRPSPFGAAPQQEQKPAAPAGNPYPPGSAKQHPPIESYASRAMDGSLTAFKGKPVTYKGGHPGLRAFDGTWTRIWFPNGPPGYYKDTELPAEAYDAKSRAQWQAFVSTGAFEGGIMPDLPPPRECTQWDF